MRPIVTSYLRGYNRKNPVTDRIIEVKSLVFFILSIAIIFGVIVGVTGCGSTEVQGRSYTSTVTIGHTHTVTIPEADFKKPPKEKIYTTSKGADGHTHKIVLREVNFSNINRRISETRLTSNGPDGHSHEITIK
jgi:hypothetical protein